MRLNQAFIFTILIAAFFGVGTVYAPATSKPPKTSTRGARDTEGSTVRATTVVPGGPEHEKRFFALVNEYEGMLHEAKEILSNEKDPRHIEFKTALNSNQVRLNEVERIKKNIELLFDPTSTPKIGKADLAIAGDKSKNQKGHDLQKAIDAFVQMAYKESSAQAASDKQRFAIMRIANSTDNWKDSTAQIKFSPFGLYMRLKAENPTYTPQQIYKKILGVPELGTSTANQFIADGGQTRSLQNFTKNAFEALEIAKKSNIPKETKDYLKGLGIQDDEILTIPFSTLKSMAKGSRTLTPDEEAQITHDLSVLPENSDLRSRILSGFRPHDSQSRAQLSAAAKIAQFGAPSMEELPASLRGAIDKLGQETASALKKQIKQHEPSNRTTLSRPGTARLVTARPASRKGTVSPIETSNAIQNELTKLTKELESVKERYKQAQIKYEEITGEETAPKDISETSVLTKKTEEKEAERDDKITALAKQIAGDGASKDEIDFVKKKLIDQNLSLAHFDPDRNTKRTAAIEAATEEINEFRRKQTLKPLAQKQATQTLQNAARGFFARKKVEQAREKAKEQKKQRDAAIKIQAFVRGQQARKNVAEAKKLSQLTGKDDFIENLKLPTSARQEQLTSAQERIEAIKQQLIFLEGQGLQEIDKFSEKELNEKLSTAQQRQELLNQANRRFGEEFSAERAEFSNEELKGAVQIANEQWNEERRQITAPMTSGDAKITFYREANAKYPKIADLRNYRMAREQEATQLSKLSGLPLAEAYGLNDTDLKKQSELAQRARETLVKDNAQLIDGEEDLKLTNKQLDEKLKAKKEILAIYGIDKDDPSLAELNLGTLEHAKEVLKMLEENRALHTNTRMSELQPNLTILKLAKMELQSRGIETKDLSGKDIIQEALDATQQRHTQEQSTVQEKIEAAKKSLNRDLTAQEMEISAEKQKWIEDLIERPLTSQERALPADEAEQLVGKARKISELTEEIDRQRKKLNLNEEMVLPGWLQKLPQRFKKPPTLDKQTAELEKKLLELYKKQLDPKYRKVKSLEDARVRMLEEINRKRRALDPSLKKDLMNLQEAEDNFAQLTKEQQKLIDQFAPPAPLKKQSVKSIFTDPINALNEHQDAKKLREAADKQRKKLRNTTLPELRDQVTNAAITADNLAEEAVRNAAVAQWDQEKEAAAAEEAAARRAKEEEIERHVVDDAVTKFGEDYALPHIKKVKGITKFQALVRGKLDRKKFRAMQNPFDLIARGRGKTEARDMEPPKSDLDAIKIAKASAEEIDAIEKQQLQDKIAKAKAQLSATDIATHEISSRARQAKSFFTSMGRKDKAAPPQKENDALKKELLGLYKRRIENLSVGDERFRLTPDVSDIKEAEERLLSMLNTERKKLSGNDEISSAKSLDEADQSLKGLKGWKDILVKRLLDTREDVEPTIFKKQRLRVPERLSNSTLLKKLDQIKQKKELEKLTVAELEQLETTKQKSQEEVERLLGKEPEARGTFGTERKRLEAESTLEQARKALVAARDNKPITGDEEKGWNVQRLARETKLALVARALGKKRRKELEAVSDQVLDDEVEAISRAREISEANATTLLGPNRRQEEIEKFAKKSLEDQSAAIKDAFEKEKKLQKRIADISGQTDREIDIPEDMIKRIGVIPALEGYAETLRAEQKIMRQHLTTKQIDVATALGEDIGKEPLPNASIEELQKLDRSLNLKLEDRVKTLEGDLGEEAAQEVRSKIRTGIPLIAKQILLESHAERKAVKKSLEARASQSLSPKDVNAIAHENLKKRNQHKQAIALINGLKEKQQSEIDAIQETLGDGQTFKTIHQARTALAKNETGDTTAKQQRATVTLAGALRTRQAQNKLEPARRAAQDKKEEQAAKTIQGLYSISKAKKEAQRIKDQQQDKRVEDAQSTIARARKAKKARSDLTQRNQPAILSSDEGASQSLPSGPQQPPSARGGEGKAVSTLEAIVKSNIINPMIETVANHFNSPAAQRESGSGGGHDESGGPGDAPSSRSLSAVAANESPSGAQSSPPAATDANSKGGRDEGTGSTPQQANVNKDSKGNDILDSKSQPNAINLILLGRERAEQQGLQLHSALDAIKLGSLTPQEYQEKLSKQGLAKDIVYDLVKLATDSDQNTTLPNTVSSGGDGQVARKQTSSHQSAERDEAAAEGGGGNPGGAQSSPPAATDANSEGKDLQSPRQSAQGVTGTASGEGGSGEEHIESGSDGGENTNRLSSRPPSVRRTQSLPATFTPANANTQVPAPSNRVHAATQTPYSISVETQTQPPSPSTSSRLSLATVAQPQKPATLTVSTQTNTRGSTTPLLSRTNSSESVSTALDSASSTPVSIATSNASHTNQDPGQLSISQLYTRAYSNTPRGRSKEPRLKTPRTPKSQKPPTADEIARALARLAGNSYKKPTPAASLAPTQPTSPHAVAVTLQGEHRPSALETVETVKPYIPPLRLDAIFKENPSDDPNTGQSSPEAETYSPDQKIVKEFLENYSLHSSDPDSLETIRMRMAIRNLAKQDGDGEFYADMARTLNEQSNSIADALRDGSISDYDKKRAAAMVEQIDRVRKTLKKTAQDDTDRARRDRIEELLDKEGREANLENLNRSPLQEALQKRLKVGKYKPGRFKRMANTLFSPFTRSPKSKDQGTTPLPVSLVQIPSPRSRLIAPPTSPGWLSPTAAWNARDEAANKKGQKRSRHS